MKLTWAIALLLVMGAFQNCADTGFGGKGVGESALNSKSSGTTKDPIKTSPPIVQNPSGEFVIDQILNKYICKTPSLDTSCLALWGQEKKISNTLTLSLNSNGSYLLRAKCFRETGKAAFKSSGGKLYVSFIPSGVESMIAEVGCDMLFNKDLVFDEALTLFHKSNQWIQGKEASIYGHSVALTNGVVGSNNYQNFLLMNQLKKPDPIVNDTFYVSGIEQEGIAYCDPIVAPVPVKQGSGQSTSPPVSKCQSTWVSFTPMYEKVKFTLSSNRRFTLEASCLIMTGSMPLVGASQSGFGIKVIVDKYAATCSNAGARHYTDPTVIAFEVLKGGVDYSISATGDAYHRIRDSKGRSLYMSKQFVPIYSTDIAGVSPGNPGSGI
jgi:hypothetical protein